jgi:hypothetical protein
MICLLKTNKFKCTVSSTLNRDIKQNGKSFMFDDRLDTCWSSDQGNQQWVSIEFEQPVTLNAIAIQFQGGFVAKSCELIMESKLVCLDEKLENTLFMETFYPEDINPEQSFKLNQHRENIFKLKLKFNESSDFFGRIVIYSLKLIG